MTTETVTLDKARIDLANDALYEITLITKALRDYMRTCNEVMDVEAVSRGMLARVQALSEAVTACLENLDPDREPVVTAALTAVIECRQQSAAIGA